jgi:hypothetical protein
MTRSLSPQIILAVWIMLIGWTAAHAQRPRNGDPQRSNRTGGRESDRTQRARPSAATAKLPEQYRSRDADGDGQIGLYEWPKTAAAYAEFKKLDANGDGFLTPTELARASGSGGSGSSGGGSGTSSSATSTASTGSSSATGDAAASAPTATSTTTSGSSTAAQRAWDVLDKDVDGKVTQTEWKDSLSTSFMFDKAGIKPTFPLTRDEFYGLYAKARPDADK